MTVGRLKSYAAQTGYVYHYYLDRQQRGELGTEYIFMVSRDCQHVFPLLVLVRADALAAWAERHGRLLSAPEAYATAKLCLFRAFDEVKELEKTAQVLAVTPGNVEALLATVGID